MTSNVGSQYIAEGGRRKSTGGSHERIEAIEEETRNKVMESLRGQFLPEFLNRIDEVILFRNLDREHIARIVDIQLERLRSQLDEMGLRLELTEAAKQQLAAEGYDPIYGARPLKRVIQQRIQNRLATEMLEGKHPRGEVVNVDYARDRFEFVNGKRTEAAKATP